jgi:TorA maturation chaperone TorD
VNRQLNNTERKSCYQLLAALFNYPEQRLLDSLDRQLNDLSSFLDLPLPSDLLQTPKLIDLEIAYTGLFINSLGGAAAPPYGSVYLETAAQLMGASCLQVAESYRREGLNLAASAEPADFLATELEFLYYLVDAESAAETKGDTSSAAGWKQKQAIFCRELLHPWLPIFCQRIQQKAGGHPLYCWAAEVLIQFCTREQGSFAR